MRKRLARRRARTSSSATHSAGQPAHASSPSHIFSVTKRTRRRTKSGYERTADEGRGTNHERDRDLRSRESQQPSPLSHPPPPPLGLVPGPWNGMGSWHGHGHGQRHGKTGEKGSTRTWCTPLVYKTHPMWASWVFSPRTHPERRACVQHSQDLGRVSPRPGQTRPSGLLPGSSEILG